MTVNELIKELEVMCSNGYGESHVLVLDDNGQVDVPDTVKIGQMPGEEGRSVFIGSADNFEHTSILWFRIKAEYHKNVMVFLKKETDNDTNV